MVRGQGRRYRSNMIELIVSTSESFSSSSPLNMRWERRVKRYGIDGSRTYPGWVGDAGTCGLIRYDGIPVRKERFRELYH